MLCALHVEVVVAVEVSVADGFHDVVVEEVGGTFDIDIILSSRG